MPSPDTTPVAVIPNGTALSQAVYIGHGNLVGVQMPAAWTTANLTFQASLDGTTFQNLFDDGGTEYTITALVSQNITIRVPVQGALWVIVRSGTSGSPVNQGAARSVTLLIKKLTVPGIGR